MILISRIISNARILCSSMNVHCILSYIWILNILIKRRIKDLFAPPPLPIKNEFMNIQMMFWKSYCFNKPNHPKFYTRADIFWPPPMLNESIIDIWRLKLIHILDIFSPIVTLTKTIPNCTLDESIILPKLSSPLT